MKNNVLYRHPAMLGYYLDDFILIDDIDENNGRFVNILIGNKNYDFIDISFENKEKNLNYISNGRVAQEEDEESKKIILKSLFTKNVRIY